MQRMSWPIAVGIRAREKDLALFRGLCRFCAGVGIIPGQSTLLEDQRQAEADCRNKLAVA